MSVELNTVHLQRIREAARAAQTGVKVCFRINFGDAKQVVWWDADRKGVQHVICTCGGSAEPWLAAVLEEYRRHLERVV